MSYCRSRDAFLPDLDEEVPDAFNRRLVIIAALIMLSRAVEIIALDLSSLVGPIRCSHKSNRWWVTNKVIGIVRRTI